MRFLKLFFAILMASALLLAACSSNTDSAGTGPGAAGENASPEAGDDDTLKDPLVSDDGYYVDADEDGVPETRIVTKDDGSQFSELPPPHGFVPDFWPGKIPIMDELKILGSGGLATFESGPEAIQLMCITEVTPEEVVAFYMDALSDWTYDPEKIYKHPDPEVQTHYWYDGEENYLILMWYNEAGKLRVHMTYNPNSGV
jgi:hypothetical protein